MATSNTSARARARGVRSVSARRGKGQRAQLELFSDTASPSVVLLPCPWCSARAAIYSEPEDVGGAVNREIQCTACGVVGVESINTEHAAVGYQSPRQRKKRDT